MTHNQILILLCIWAAILVVWAAALVWWAANLVRAHLSLKSKRATQPIPPTGDRADV